MLKKKTNLLLLASVLMLTASSQAQTFNLTQPANDLNNQLKTLFPIVAGILFIVVALINLGHFTKEGGDWKKGMFNILIFVIVVGCIAGMYSYITSVHL